MAILPTQPHAVIGDDGLTFFNLLEAVLDQLEANDQTVEDRLEATGNALSGTGVVAGSYTPPIISAGAGLAANVGTFTYVMGYGKPRTSSGSVALTASTTNHIYIRQDGTLQANTTGINPGTVANPAIKLGTATTNASAVTGVADTFDLVSLVKSVTGTAPINVATGTTTPVISLNDTAVTPGTYTRTTLTVDQKGRITAASSGAAPGLDDVVATDPNAGATINSRNILAETDNTYTVGDATHHFTAVHTFQVGDPANLRYAGFDNGTNATHLVNGNNGGTVKVLANGTGGQAWIESNANLRLEVPTALTVGAAGGASALPATPTGYIRINIGGTDFKIPYYAD